MDADPSKADLTRRLRVGSRVVLRWRDTDGLLTDALGVLESVTDEHAVVLTRRGRVEVPRAAVVTGKEVPPPPERRGRARQPDRGPADPADVLPAEVDELERVMVGAHPPAHTRRLGGWLLRAAGGYTARANSTLVLGEPGTDLAGALTRVRKFSAEHGITPRLALPLAAGADPDRHPVVRAGGGRWHTRVHVMTAETAALRAASPRAGQVLTAPTGAWVAGCAPREREHEADLRALLGRVADLRLLAVGDETGRPAAVARLSLHPGWAGVLGVHVRPEVRRRGLGRQVMALAAGVAAEAGVPRCFLQVEAGSTAAVSLYRSLGWQVHHDYGYVDLPAPA